MTELEGQYADLMRQILAGLEPDEQEIWAHYELARLSMFILAEKDIERAQRWARHVLEKATRDVQELQEIAPGQLLLQEVERLAARAWNDGKPL